MKKPYLWTVIPIVCVMGVTAGPWISLLSNLLFTKDFTTAFPNKLENGSCPIDNGLRCKGSLEFAANGTRHDILYGISTAKSKVYCVDGETTTELVASRMVSYLAVFSNVKCKGKIISALEEGDPIPPSSWLIPMMVEGEKDSLDRYAKSVLFYANDVRPFIAPLAIFQIFLIIIIFSTMGIRRAFRYKHTFYLVSTMAIMNSGLLERFSGLAAEKYFPVIVTSLAFGWAFTFFLESSKTFYAKKQFKIAYGLAAVFGVLSFFKLLPLLIVFPSLAFLWVVSAFKAENKTPAAQLALVNLTYMVPMFSQFFVLPLFAGSFFFLIFCIGYQFEQIKFALLESRISRLASEVHTEKRLFALLKYLSRKMGGAKVTLARTATESFKIVSISPTRQMPAEVLSSSQPLVISRVYATGRAMINVDEQGEGTRDIANKGKTYRSSQFSALPVTNAGEILAALCMTDYQKALTHSETSIIFYNFLESVSNSIGVAVRAIEQHERTSLIGDVFEVVGESGSLEECIDTVFQKMFEKYGISSYFAEVDDLEELTLLNTSGTLTQLMADANMHRFKITAENKFGALSIALFERRVVIQQNWRVLGDRISSAAQDFYIRSGTNSIMCVPVFIKMHGRELRYLVWMQSNHDLVFTNAYAEVGDEISKVVERKIRSLLNDVASTALLGMAESEAVRALVRGSSTEHAETGWLAMVDLGRSTILRERASIRDYENVIAVYRTAVISAFSKIGFNSQMFIGDAIILTKSSSVANDLLDLEIVDKELLKAEQVVADSIKSFFAESTREPAFRVCLAFGDISRKMVVEAGGGWSVVGATLSTVHKIEGLAKSSRNGFLFFTADSPAKVDAIPISAGEIASANLGQVLFLPFQFKSGNRDVA